MSAFLNELKAIWARLDGGQRMVVSSVLFASLVGLGALVWYASQPDYREVYRGDQLAEARDALRQGKIAFRAEGNVLKVDRDDYGEASSLLAMGGIGGDSEPGLMDSMGGIIADRDTRLAMLSRQKLLTAESAIQALDDVRWARVTASKPKASPWKRDDPMNVPSATASIRLRAGANFFQVAPHVASQVASATGVPIEHVKVVDAVTHQDWVESANAGNAAEMNQFLALQDKMSEDLTRDAQWALEKIYPGLTQVMVRVELDNNWETRKENLFPPEPVLKSDKKTETKSENGTRPAGDPGVAANAGQAPAASRGTISTTRDMMRDQNFVTDGGERQLGKLAPDIKRITTTVFIDRGLETQEAAIIASVESIIGRDASRGDPATIALVTDFPTSEVIDMPDSSGFVSAVQSPGAMGLLREWGPTIGQILGVLLVLWFLRGMLKRASPTPEAAAAAAQAQKTLSAEEATQQVRNEIEKAIADDPAAISRLLEGWLTEQKA